MKNRICFFFTFLLPLFIFSQTINGWRKQSSFPPGTLSQSSAFSLDETGYVIFGTNHLTFNKEFWKYLPEQDKWLEMKKFPGTPRMSAVVFTIGNKAYTGTGLYGVENLKEGTSDFWEYDPAEKTWSQQENFPGGKRSGAAGFSINGKGYISLGMNQNTNYNDLWEYNPATNKWSKKADFPEPGRSDASVFVIGGEAYMVFGQAKELFPTKKNSWKYSPEKNEWKQFSEFPDAPRTGAIVFALGNKGYALGGTNGVLKRFEDFWEYDPAKDKWLKKNDVPFGACAYGFSFVAGNSAFVCTGKTKSGVKGSEMWKYNPSADGQSAGIDFAIGGNLLLGEERIPLAAAEVKIFNSKNQEIKNAFTNLFGSFLFTQLPENEEWVIALTISDPGWQNQKFYLVNRKNETVGVLDKSNSFKLQLSSSNKDKIQLIKIENKNLRMNLQGKLAIDDKKKTPMTNTDVSLINEEEQVVQTSATDDAGHFKFTYLPVDSTLYLSVDPQKTSSLPKGSKILLMDESGTVIGKATAARPEFKLVNLPPDQNTLGTYYAEDPWLAPMMKITRTNKNTKEEFYVIEYIYFDYSKWNLLSEAKAVLNKAVALLKSSPEFFIEISAHTDSRGDTKYNLDLSEKRASAAKDYMMSKGAKQEQITAKGYGEKHLLNHCKDGVPCSEEEHAENRRMEFKIKRK